MQDTTTFSSAALKQYSRLISLSVLSTILVLSGCSSSEEPTIETAPPKAIKYFTVGEEFGGSVRRVTGVVEPSDRTNLSFRVGGKVANVLVKQGDLVTVGQVLAELDPKDYRTALNSAQAQLNQARAEQQNTAAELKRNRQLLVKQLVSQSSFDSLEATAKSALSKVTIAEENVNEAQRKLDRTKLKAPFAGIIDNKEVEAFQSIESGKTVFELQGDTGFKVKVPVPETMMPFIEYGQVVSASFPGLPNQNNITGQISSIGSRVEAGSSFPVKVQLTGNIQNIRAGMTSNVTFSFKRSASSEPVYMIPISAITGTTGSNDAGRYDAEGGDSTDAAVLIFNKATNTLENRSIQLGDIRDNNVEVISGIKKDEIIAAAGLPFLFDGQQVTLWEPQWRSKK